jgi:hypothetical protein
VRAQLADGPKPGASVEAAAEAAEISEPLLITAANKLGVRTPAPGSGGCRPIRAQRLKCDKGLVTRI